jgi:hypothetical protein
MVESRNVDDETPALLSDIAVPLNTSKNVGSRPVFICCGAFNGLEDIVRALSLSACLSYYVAGGVWAS